MSEENKEVDFRCSQNQIRNILNKAVLEGMLLQLRAPEKYCKADTDKERISTVNRLEKEISKLNLNL